ncbi:restriction endonuclease [Escherichia coli]|nr:restriction endonuclease [Escherichia coli]EIO3927211.1 restriction endonuclease [Escherichia coli]
MQRLSPGEFKTLISKERKSHFITPFALVYKTFCDLGYDQKNSDYFLNNPSEYIIAMRKNCWKEFEPFEKEFTTRMLSYLIDEERIKDMSPYDAIRDFTMEYPTHIYNLALSNTQSRRSRAGKEFESILELLMMGAGIPVDVQGAIGKSFFQKNQIGKLVDLVMPGVVQYTSNKRNTMLISAKTTLRERWQEVPEEVNRTGIREMYLATLDDSFSEETINILYEANVVVVTTIENKNFKYKNNNRVLTFEDMLQSAMELSRKWNNVSYTDSEKEEIQRSILKQIEKYSDFPYVVNYYRNRLSALFD